MMSGRSISHVGTPGSRSSRTRDGGLSVRGPQERVDQFVRVLVDAGLALRALELSETPLETLFFMLTESHSDGSLHAPSGAGV